MAPLFPGTTELLITLAILVLLAGVVYNVYHFLRGFAEGVQSSSPDSARKHR